MFHIYSRVRTFHLSDRRKKAQTDKEQWACVWATNRVGLFSILVWHAGVYWSRCESALFSESLCFHRCFYPQSELHHEPGVIAVWYGSLHFLSQQQHEGEKGASLFSFFSPLMAGWMAVHETAQYVLSLKRNKTDSRGVRGYLLFVWLKYKYIIENFIHILALFVYSLGSFSYYLVYIVNLCHSGFSLFHIHT